MRFSMFPLYDEIKEQYCHLRRNGIGRADTVTELQEIYEDELTLGSEDDGLIFYIAVADAQYALKELSEHCASNALAALSQAAEIEDWEISASEINKRKTRYIQAPMPERMNFRERKKFRCQWQIGDTFAYLLKGCEAEQLGIDGLWMLIRKIDEIEFGDGQIIPIVTLAMWKNKDLPSTAEEIIQTPIMRLCNGRMLKPKNLFEYRLEIVFTSQKQVENLNLTYLGNFPNFSMPADEIVFSRAGDMLMATHKTLDRNFSVCYNFDLRHPR